MTEIVKELLMEDIDLKNELNEQFAKIDKRLTQLVRRLMIAFILIGICIVTVVIANSIYFDKTKELFFNEVQEKMDSLNRKQYQQDSLLRLQKEIFYRLRDTNKHYNNNGHLK